MIISGSETYLIKLKSSDTLEALRAYLKSYQGTDQEFDIVRPYPHEVSLNILEYKGKCFQFIFFTKEHSTKHFGKSKNNINKIFKCIDFALRGNGITYFRTIHPSSFFYTSL